MQDLRLPAEQVIALMAAILVRGNTSLEEAAILRAVRCAELIYARVVARGKEV